MRPTIAEDPPLQSGPTEFAAAAERARHLILVGDRFAGFADGEKVCTVSQFVAMANANGSHPWVIHVGQGIEAADLDAAAGSGSAMLVSASDPLPLPVVPLAAVHKHRPENVLIAQLRHWSETRCSAALSIHPDNEFVVDHASGAHISGTVIIEAMRQLCTAQFETGHRSSLPPGEYAGIWHRMTMSFENLLFPFRAEVGCVLTDVAESRRSDVRFKATTTIHQNGKLVATSDMEYSLVKRKRFNALERYKAGHAVESGLPEH